MKYYDCILKEIPEHKNINFSETMLIIYAHILENNHDFFNSLIAAGFKTNNVIIFGKSYSTNVDIAAKLSSTGLFVFNIGYPDRFGDFYDSSIKEIKSVLKNIIPPKNIIVMESGGLLRNIVQNLFRKKSNITGVELTSQGTYYDCLFPTINVAQSDVKITDEPIVIAKCAYKIMKQRNLINKDKIYGIIGNGVIGNSLNKYMLSKGISTITYDNKYDDDGVLKRLKTESDYIIGATGRDCLKKFNDIKAGCFLISMSSGDIEFNSVLKDTNISSKNNNLFSDINIGHLHVINGGFPITFDRRNGSEDREIIITYGLWLVGIVQAGLNHDRKVGLIDLNENYQKIVKKCFCLTDKNIQI